METKKKKHGCLTAIVAIVILIVVGTIVGRVGDAKAKRDRERSYNEILWPTSDLASHLPQPENQYGEITYDSEGRLEFLIAKQSKDAYAQYVNTCMQSGYTVNYSKGTDYFWADNQDGYSLSVNYEEEYKEMEISITAPVKKAEETPAPDEEAEISEETETEPAATEEPQPTATTEPEGEEKTENGIRPEFKEVVDNYEEFMNEYVDFMKKYQDADGSDAQMLLDYANFLSKYADMEDTYDKLGDEDMSDAESTYYLQAQARVLAKLSEIA